jgi:phosphoribosylanthranilate isomerase
MKIKICGISNTEILQYACEMGADFTGFIMADKSPRKISKDFLASLKNFDFQKTIPVFVFVNPTIDEVMKIVTSIPKSILQFHGDESNEFCKQFNQPFWKAIRVENSKSLEQIHDFSSAEA